MVDALIEKDSSSQIGSYKVILNLNINLFFGLKSYKVKVGNTIMCIEKSDEICLFVCIFLGSK